MSLLPINHCAVHGFYCGSSCTRCRLEPAPAPPLVDELPRPVQKVSAALERAVPEKPRPPAPARVSKARGPEAVMPTKRGQNVGLEIRRVRIDRGVSQEELGRRIGQTQQAVSALERGLYLPDPELLKSIWRALLQPPPKTEARS